MASARRPSDEARGTTYGATQRTTLLTALSDLEAGPAPISKISATKTSRLGLYRWLDTLYSTWGMDTRSLALYRYDVIASSMHLSNAASVWPE